MLALTLSLPFRLFSQKYLTVPPQKKYLGVTLGTHPMIYKARPSFQTHSCKE